MPVLDFIALNQQAETTAKIFEFFKERNPKWSQITSVVIDKDFVEWAVLTKCLPSAKVVLCQYHVISFWQKLLLKRKYNLRQTHRESVKKLISSMIYRYVDALS